MAIPLKRSAQPRRSRLLQGASAIAFTAAFGTGPAWAQLAALHNAAHVSGGNASGAPGIAAPVVPGLSPTAQSAAARQLQNAMKAQQAVTLAQQAQTAAQQAAAALPSSVPNGLAPGGLVPIPNPTLAANDPTGLNTWQGANLPTQSTGANGAVTVNVQQTASRAILDWITFNVGANTTLNFDQSQGGVAQPGWVVLNRIVGQIDPTTGLRNPNLGPAPSQILGSIKAQGTVLVINQNGILFGPNAQVNTNSLIATSLEIGNQLSSAASTFDGVPLSGLAGGGGGVASTIAQRDEVFLTDGILAGGETFSGQAVTTLDFNASGKPTGVATQADPTLEGAVTVETGAQITSGQGGYIILAAPTVTNSGVLTSSQGQVSLVSGRSVTLTPSDGTSNGSNNPDIRGLIVQSSDNPSDFSGNAFSSDSVENTATGLIQSSEGYASLTSTPTGSVENAGVITATTSVSRNGFIQLTGENITLAPSSVIAITPDDDGTIPQDPNSLADFKPSQISIGEITSAGTVANGASVNIGANSLIYAPSANIYIDEAPGGSPTSGLGQAATPQVFIDAGAVIDASGLKNVQVSGASQLVTIDPVTANDSADTPTQRNVLDGVTVRVDPRLSGVRSDGVAWVGSPLIPAQDFAQQIGVRASQLMTKGGNVVIGGIGSATTPSTVIKPGATIDISGGWITFTAGLVQTTELVSASGALVNIADANPDDVYLGVYNGFSTVQPRYGISNTFASPLLTGGYFEPAYTQGADAGSLTIKSSQPLLQGTIYADAFAGPVQAQNAQVGTGAPTVFGDQRNVQAAGSELPAAGFLFIEGAGSGVAPDVEIAASPTPTTAANLGFGQPLPTDQTSIGAASPPLVLSASALSAMGLGQLSIQTIGALTVDAGANVILAPGGVFSGLTGRSITINGAVTAPSGTINLQTGAFPVSGPFTAGEFDVAVNGQLSAAGLWTNDDGASGTAIQGPGYINGGSINITVLQQDAVGIGNGVATVPATQGGTAPQSTTDVSGSILIDGPNSLLNVSAGGYVAPNGALDLTAKGGNVTLTDPTAYFPFFLAEQQDPNPTRADSFIPGFRVNGISSNPSDPSSGDEIAINPNAINAQVAIGDGAIQGYGFAGGGTFTLTTPAIAFGDGIAATGTNLPLDFFSKAGFGTYNIISYATDLLPNTFTNGLGGFNAVLATQVLTINSGQTLNLTQTGYSTRLSGAQIAALRALASGGQLSSVIAPSIQPDAFDQNPISLNFGGLIEFEVAAGGTVTGAPGASLSAPQIYNQGVIRLPGGTLSQSESLPAGYAGFDELGATTVLSAPTLSDIFSINADGSIDENAKSVADPSQTNAQVAANDYIFLTGNLPANVGIDLAPGSVTDLSGVVVVNPNATGVTQGRQIVTGNVINGGTLSTGAAVVPSSGDVVTSKVFLQTGLSLIAQPGAVIDLEGASGVFDQLTSSGQYVQAPQWSNGGALTLGAGGTLTGAIINAHGGAPQAAGGVLTTTALTLTATDPATPTADTLSAEAIEAAGFGTLVVQGDLTTSGGPVDLTLGQAFYVMGAPSSTVLNAFNNASGALAGNDALNPVISVAGSLQINAPYISLDGGFQTLSGPMFDGDSATAATGNVVFNAQALDVIGAVLFDQAVANVTLRASGDLRFIGVEPFQVNGQSIAPSLMGQLAVNGNLNLVAAQVYATTGTSFQVTSAAKAGTITIASSGGPTPATPYSAGSNLTIQAANIVQDGVLRAPIGSLTLGGDSALGAFAPATVSLELGAGSITSVSADGLSIPYGTTTDQTEYFFSPTNANALTAPPPAALTLSGGSISTASGATVDLNGGGDVFAYEFIPGTGGSRDILSQFNTDAFTSNGGFQFADHRQVYAIVPGLSNAPVAAFDPIYSSNYGSLYSPSLVGQRVYLNGGSGVAAGWYTLLPAQYAVLPGGMEVVEDTSAKTVPVGSSQRLLDGTVAVTGEFGGLGGSVQSTPHVFDIKDQAVINEYSDIALTSGNATFAAQAASAGTNTPRLPTDAGQLIINPGTSLDLSGNFLTAPAAGGRGSEVDITGSSLEVVSAFGPAIPGVIQLSADQLSGLNADSLLIGGLRTDNADGTTTLDVTAQQIVVANNAAHPLTGPDIVLAADGSGAAITLKDGATITASGTDATGQTGDYIIDGSTPGQTGQGALVRVSAGPQRLVTRQNVSATAQPGVITVGAVDLSGNSVLLDSSGAFSLSTSAILATVNLALDASSITFAPSAQGLGGLVITPALLTSLSQAQNLTLRSPNVIGFADGSYGFGNLDLDTPGVSVTGGAGAVTVSAQAVQVQDDFTDAGACAGGGALACGAGQFTLDAQSLTFGNGTFRIYGAGQGVTLAAPNGVFFQGQGALDVGAAPLAIQTAFLGDQAAPNAPVGIPAVLPSLAISTTRDITLSNPTGAAVPTVTGVPGATLTLTGQDLSVTGVDVRATAGTLTATIADNITVGAGAILETPGFSESFGDAADPFSESAPGGLLTLTATSGNINLAAGSTLSVGGGAGNAGSLTLNASQGTVSFGGALNGAAPGGGAGFTLNEAGAFDLTGFVTSTAGAFNGQVSIQTGAGNLALAAGQTLTAADVTLTADGGLVDIGGTINVSGVNGGDIGLFGTGGVTLESTAQLLARASGYGPTDTRQASGGEVELGTAGTGALTVASGAVIDVSALNPNARIVQGEENGVITYNYVAGDQGGTVTLRAPVSGGDGAETVNVSFAGAIKGASSIVLEGYKAYDLGAIAASGQYSGVTVSNGVAILDTTATGAPNFLADNAPGTLVDFIQNFNVSGSYANLGGLASQANFQARPGVELDYRGDITLASNWNLGAGVVNVAGAVAAGLMVPDPGVPGAYSIIPGDEAAVFSNFTTLTYRVGGSVLGAPGDLTIKAGGQLDIDGSITDGFFTFGDQTNPTYLANAIGAGDKVVNGVLNTSSSSNGVSVNFLGTIGTSAVSTPNLIPYEANANTPGALGSGSDASNGMGDPIGSAEVFPLVQTPTGPVAVGSWSYQLTGGAAAGSANPLRVQAGASGGVTVQGNRTYNYGGSAAQTTFSNTLLLGVGAQDVTADQWLAAELAANPALTAASPTSFSFSSAPAAIRLQLEQLAASFFDQHPGESKFTGGSATAPTGVTTSLGLAAQFLQAVAADWSSLNVGYKPPNSAIPPATTVVESNVIRTGTGSINVAAAGDINLQNNDPQSGGPNFLNPGNGAEANSSTGFEQGGAAIYTVGALAVPETVTAVDTTTGQTVTLDPSAFETLTDDVGTTTYGYGVSGTAAAKGLSGILVANPVYLQGGGSVSLNAGRDVLGRLDAFDQDRLLQFDRNLNQGAGFAFLGFYDQPWRMGTVGAPGQDVSTNIQINPQLFTTGVGTLGGGDVTVKAGRNVSDLTIVADTTATTATATGGVATGQVDQGQLTFGGGDVSVTAGGDLLGGRIDVASGTADLTIGGSVMSAGPVKLGSTQSTTQGAVVADLLQLRLSDATVDLSVHGDVEIQGIAALGVQNAAGSVGANTVSNAYAENFYSFNAGVSIVADGSVTLDNTLDGLNNIPVGVASTTAVLPGSLTVIALEGDLNLNSGAQIPVLLDPSPTGTMTLAAGADITGATLAMLDSEPGSTDVFPVVLPNSTQAQLQAEHDPANLHQNDPVPNRIYAGADIDDLIVSTPKQTRIGAGRDIVNMMFFGQNLNSSDITRIVAGRDITATTELENATTLSASGSPIQTTDQESTVQGNTFVLGGPGSLIIQAGRNLGPFLNSATLDIGGQTESFAGGVLTVGNTWNPNLAPQSANITVEFGVAKGQDFNALLNYYLNPDNTANLPDYLFNETLNSNNVFTPNRSQPIYAPQLIAYMQANQPKALLADFGTTSVTYAQAYQAFAALPPLQQEPFLLQVYFSELSLTSTPGPTLDNFQRGYTAVNLLFPSSLGYTANNLSGGTNGANTQVETGNLDLRLATIETQFGGNIDILGPGGRVLAGSTVATAQQAARRFSEAPLLFEGERATANGLISTGPAENEVAISPIGSIPAGFEGVLTLRGGNISTFTDGDFVLNQSRLFTEQGGNIIMWSSNGNLNAGEGPKSSSDFPPVTVTVDENAFSTDDEASSVTGAGIAAFAPAPGVAAPNIFLIAPRGTVDAGAAGVRFSGDLFIAALHVANADNFTNIGGGTAIGLPPTSTTVVVAPGASSVGASAIKAAQAVAAGLTQPPPQDRSIITVEVLGFGDAS